MRIHTSAEIALLVREQRQRRGWSQTEFAERLGVTRQWVHRLETGQTRIELGLTLRALNAVGLTLEVTPPDFPTSDPTDGRRRGRE